MLLRNQKGQRMVLYFLASALFIVFFVMQFANGGVAYAQEGDSLDVENTAKNLWEMAKTPLYFVAGAALAIGAIIFMFSRGSPEKHRQARLGLGVAIAGFLIGTFALGILNLVKTIPA